MKQLQKAIHQTAKQKGWYDPPKTPLEMYALVHSEVSEAVEEARLDNPPIWFKSTIAGPRCLPLSSIERKRPDFHKMKPEGELIEIADVVIRLMDMCEYKGWDLEEAIKIKMAYNETRPHRHGGKKY